MSTTDAQRVGGLRTEIFYISVIIAISLVAAFFVGVSYQSTTAMIAEANEQTDIALGVIAAHGPSSDREIREKRGISINSTSSTSTDTELNRPGTAVNTGELQPVDIELTP